ncbi:MAG: DUF1269 domain-containing protein [Deltaproteobacteria bacterium]|nr:DUF1269 domain-containing protein [Deltaproteobacteria bacterium]
MAKFTDIGVPDGTVEAIGKALEPSTTALALLVSHIDDDASPPSCAASQRELWQTDPPEMVERLRAALHAAP